MGGKPKLSSCVPKLLSRNGRGSLIRSPEHALSRGPSADPLLLLCLETNGQEIRESGAIVIQDAESTVAGPCHRLGFFDEVVQENPNLDISFEQQRRIQHPSKLGGILNRPKRHRTRV